MTTETKSDHAQPLTRFWQPRYWLIWLGLAWLRLMSLLPVRTQLALGRGLGKLIYVLLPGRRALVQVHDRPDRPGDLHRRRRRLLAL